MSENEITKLLDAVSPYCCTHEHDLFLKALRLLADKVERLEGGMGWREPKPRGEWIPMLETHGLQISFYVGDTLEIRDGQQIYIHLDADQTRDLLNWLDHRESKPPPNPEPSEWAEKDRVINSLSKTVTALCESIDPDHTHGPETEKIVAHCRAIRETGADLCNTIDCQIGRQRGGQYEAVQEWRDRLKALLGAETKTPEKPTEPSGWEIRPNLFAGIAKGFQALDAKDRRLATEPKNGEDAYDIYAAGYRAGFAKGQGK